MSEDCLRLTAYFGERDRVDGRLVADELLDVYAGHQVRTSILVRGAEGFGRPHGLRTDRLLSLSEDLPVVAVAVDRGDRIEAMLESVRQVTHRGLLTVERVRRLTGDLSGGALSGASSEGTKLTVHVGRRERVGRRPAHVAVCDVLFRHGMAGASVLLGVDGTRDGRRTRARLLHANGEVPMMILAVGGDAATARVLEELSGLLTDPIITAQRVRVCKRDGELLATPAELPGTDEPGRATWQKLVVHTSQAATRDGRPLDLEIIRRLRGSPCAGATSLRGVWGFHGGHAPHGDRFRQLRRHVPVVTVTVDAPERAAPAFAVIDEVTGQSGLVTSETVEVLNAP